MSALRFRGVHPWLDGVGLDLDLAVGERVVMRGPKDDLDDLFHILCGRARPDAGTIDVFGEPHPGGAIRHRSWGRRVALSRGELHLIENIDLVRNLTVPMVFALDIPERRARQLALEVLDDLGLSEFAYRRPAQVETHIRQIVHLARATTPGRELTILFDPQEGLLGDEATDRLSFLLSDCPTAIILCSESWLAPPTGFTERDLERTR